MYAREKMSCKIGQNRNKRSKGLTGRGGEISMPSWFQDRNQPRSACVQNWTFFYELKNM